MHFIVKIAPESSTKSRSVRQWHFKQLQRNIVAVLKRMECKVRIITRSDRIELDCDDDKADACQARLAEVPGIHSILRVDVLNLPENNPLEFLAETSLKYFADTIEGKSFAVRCKRSGKHKFSSMEVERTVGSALFLNSKNNSIQLKNPDVTVPIEIRHDKAYLVSDKTMGLGGYPLGTQGTALSLISGGYDSSVASFKMMRRGCRMHYLFFNLGGTAHSLGAKQAALFLWMKYGCSHKAVFHTVSLDSLVAELMQLPNASLNGVLLKRAMLKVAELIANKHKVKAIITGESLAQVSSQTMANLSVIDKATEHLVIRPLIASDKREIIDTAEKIGSAIFAQNMVEYCGVISYKPNVAVPLEDLIEAEEKMGNQWFQDALNSSQRIDVADIINDLNKQPQVEMIKEVSDQVVIDIRGVIDVPMDAADMHIEFYKLNQQFPDLAQDKDYLLYCERGVMSQLHAAYLHEQGFNNVKVYRPD